MKLLPENPTQFDYLHAIRALAARGDMSAVPKLKEIFNLADAGMFAKKEPPAHIRLCGWRGMAGGDGCILPLGHDGGHGFRDGSGYLPNVKVKCGNASPPTKSDGE